MTPLPRFAWTLETPGFRKVFESPELRIFITFGTLHNGAWFHKIRPNDIALIQLPCHVSDDYIKWEAWLLRKHEYPIDRIYFLCNSQKQYDGYIANKLQAVLINQNCFISTTVFAPIPEVQKIYDAVYVARPAKFKRHELAVEVGNLALISGHRFNNVENIDLAQIPHTYLSEKRLTHEEVNAKTQQAYCGLILSENEGACYASSEYLLAGLPVVSTPSEGGRDFWYNKDNSIICDPTPKGVAEAVKQAVAKVKSGEFDAQKIRQSYLALTDLQRDCYRTFIQKILAERGLSVDPLAITIQRTPYVPLAEVEAFF
jgi:glycosyltransferase involved in cell wall biosynthesis